MMIPVVIGVIVLVFTIMYLTPGDPAEIMLGESATPEQLAAKRASWAPTSHTSCSLETISKSSCCTETSAPPTPPASR